MWIVDAEKSLIRMIFQMKTESEIFKICIEKEIIGTSLFPLTATAKIAKLIFNVKRLLRVFDDDQVY